MEKTVSVDGYVIEVDGHYFSGYNNEYDEANFSETDLRNASVMRCREDRIKQFAEGMLEVANPNDVDKNAEIHIYRARCQITILD